MASKLNPYINFGGDAKQAMEHYQRVFGGELKLNTFAEFGQKDAPFADKIMHAQLETKNGFTLMGSDTPPGMPRTVGDSISISLSGENGDELRSYWTKLADGGAVVMKLEKQMWGDEFGMCKDKFGIGWMVNITAKR